MIRAKHEGPAAALVGAGAIALGAFVAFASGACGPGNGTPYIMPNDGGGTEGGTNETIAFDAGPSLVVAVASSVTIDVTTGQNGSITWWLDGAYADASLADTTTEAAGGHASIVLRATSSAASFALHARTAGGATAVLAIRVPAPAFVTVDVHPEYSGTRVSQTAPVVASIFEDTTCAALSGQPIVDGTMITQGTVDSTIAIADIPTGVAVAIGVRIGHFAFGCADVKTATGVTVQIVDRLATFDKRSLTLDLFPTPTTVESAAFVAILDRARQHAEAAFGADSAEPGALLDAMATVAGGAGQMSAFTDARAAGGWDAKTATWLGAHPTLVGDQIDPWMTAATMRGLGDLVLDLAPATGGSAPTSVISFANVGPASSGILVLGPFLWSADTHDNVTLNGAMVFDASRLLTAITAAPDGTSTVPAALASAIDCAGLGAALTTGGVSYPGCNAACTASLCSDALVAMWADAAAASETAPDPTELTLTAGGTPVIDDEASVVQFSGTWKEQLSGSTGNSTLSGTLTTVLPR